jgi:hypothetical protein
MTDEEFSHLRYLAFDEDLLYFPKWCQDMRYWPVLQKIVGSMKDLEELIISYDVDFLTTGCDWDEQPFQTTRLLDEFPGAAVKEFDIVTLKEDHIGDIITKKHLEEGKFHGWKVKNTRVVFKWGPGWIPTRREDD